MAKLLPKQLVLFCLDCNRDFNVTRKDSCNTKEWSNASKELNMSQVEKLKYLFQDEETWIFYPYFHCTYCNSTNFEKEPIVGLYKSMKDRLEKREDLTSIMNITRILDAYISTKYSNPMGDER